MKPLLTAILLLSAAALHASISSRDYDRLISPTESRAMAILYEAWVRRLNQPPIVSEEEIREMLRGRPSDRRHLFAVGRWVRLTPQEIGMIRLIDARIDRRAAARGPVKGGAR